MTDEQIIAAATILRDIARNEVAIKDNKTMIADQQQYIEERVREIADLRLKLAVIKEQ